MKFKEPSKLILALFVLAFCAATVRAQDEFPYDVYKPRTVSEMVALNADGKNADVVYGKTDAPQMVLYADFLHSQTRVKFANKSRPISAARRELLKFWQTTFKMDEKILNLYENEYLFKECESEHWIPVQKQVAAYFPKELKEGDMISLFLMRGGGRKVGSGWDWVFLVNEFKK